MPKVFISYRRSETAAVAGRVFDHLKIRLGEGQVFKDVYSMAAGRDFREDVREAVTQSDVVLVFIGTDWLKATSKAGEQRLDKPNDPVRREIEQALELGVPIIPVLVENAEMPAPDDLPESLERLAYLHGTRLRDADFDYDVGRLCDGIAAVCGNIDRRANRRRLLVVGGGAALAVAMLAAAWVLSQFVQNSNTSSAADLAVVLQRIDEMESRNRELQAQLMSVRSDGKRGDSLPQSSEQVSASTDDSTMDFRTKVNRILDNATLDPDQKRQTLTAAFINEIADLGEQAERQAKVVQSLQGTGSPSLDVETLKLKRLVDKRSQVFDMLRQSIDQYNVNAKEIIRSMGR